MLKALSTGADPRRPMNLKVSQVASMSYLAKLPNFGDVVDDVNSSTR